MSDEHKIRYDWARVDCPTCGDLHSSRVGYSRHTSGGVRVSNSIHRQRIQVLDYQEIEITGPVIAAAADRNGANDYIDIWWEHYDPAERAGYEPSLQYVRAIYIFGTGHDTPWTIYTRHAWKHIGTVVTPSNYLIWHVYEGPKKGDPIAV
jgi:hypothetical protein